MTPNIEIHCAECVPTFKAFSEEEIYQHIKSKHPSYTTAQAREHAYLWTEDAYEDQQQEAYETMLAYKKDQLRRAIWN